MNHQIPRTSGHVTAAFPVSYFATYSVQPSNSLTVRILQGPPEASAAVRQLPAPVPAVAAQRVQDAVLCYWKNPLLCGPGSPWLWP